MYNISKRPVTPAGRLVSAMYTHTHTHTRTHGTVQVLYRALSQAWRASQLTPCRAVWNTTNARLLAAKTNPLINPSSHYTSHRN